MFGIPSVGRAASLCILRESQSAELLEEVDEDDLTLDTGFSSEQSNEHSWTSLLSVAVPVVGCCIALQLFSLIVIISMLVVFAYLIWTVGAWRLKTFVQKLNEMDVVARKANRGLLQREMLSFGLGLSTSQALSACRLRVFICCRENVMFLSTLADRLVSAQFMKEERRRLVSSFYTEEMLDLVESSANSKSSHITQRGIGALLDLFVLHRSEVLRLLVLYFFRSPPTSTLTLLFYVFSELHRQIDKHIEQCRATERVHRVADGGSENSPWTMSDPILAHVSQRQAQVDRPADGDNRHINMRGSMWNAVNARTSPGSDLQEARPPPVVKKRGLPREERPRLKTLVRVGSLNVGTLTGKTREIADFMARRRIHVLCLQETRWKGSKAREIGDGIKLFYHGIEAKRNGMAIAVSEPLKEYVSSVNRVSDRIISLRVATEDGFWTVMSVYAPQCGCTEAEKEAFYDELDDVIRSAPEGDYITVAGDFNGHVGQDRKGFERVHGGRGFGRRNQEDERIVELAKAHDLAIASTFFIKRESQKITYCSGGRQSEIDYILVRRRFLKTVKNVKTIPGEEIAGQHRPVVADVCIALQKHTKAKREPRIRWWKLAGETQKTFRDKIIATGLPEPYGHIDSVWASAATTILTCARDTLGGTKGGRKGDRATWFWSEDVQKIGKAKKDAYKAWQKTKSLPLLAEYKLRKKEAKAAVARAKNAVMDELYDKLESSQAEKHVFRLAKARYRAFLDVTEVKAVKNVDVIINTLSRRRSREAKTHSALEPAKVNELDAVALALEDIITGITGGDLTADEVKRALQRVLSMNAFMNPNAKHTEVIAEEVELADNLDMSRQRGATREFAPPAPLCDEVYEVIASHDGVEQRDVHSFEDDDYSVERSRELMDELRMALAGRAVEFAARERKALAAFYGVSDTELEALEESLEREQPPADVAHAENQTDTLYESSAQGEELDDEWTSSVTSFAQNRARTLPSDLLSALRMRSVAEEVIGDVDD
ncbi:hypothetical protein Y032_0001g336 [Ancylostoma ceylanicum]|nr:hypothetical protein Y032_0001g336 [Ancylostoma ceylanicum]